MRTAAGAFIALIGVTAPLIAADAPALVRARGFYNAANYDAAIEAATLARRQPAAADAAALVLARAHIERYRTTRIDAELVSARQAIHGITRVRLGPRQQLDLLIALGQILFFDDDFGAAAEVFESALVKAPLLPQPARGQLLDWWAHALDREAKSRPQDPRPPDQSGAAALATPRGRATVYARLVARMEQEAGNDPVSATANYWLPAAIRGAGDLDRAWDAAIASWVRSSLDPQTAPAVRADLDRLAQALALERSRHHPVREQADAANALRAEWDEIKSKW